MENIILSHSRRGIDQIRHVLPEGYCGRAAHMIIDNPGTVVIGTGFPVKNSSVTSSDELVIATVSNWRVYGVIASMSRILKQDLFSTFDPQVIIAYLVNNGSVDGVTARPECSEDGFDLSVGLSVIERLRGLLGRQKRSKSSGSTK